MTPRRPALLHRGDRLSSAVGSVLLLVPLLILTCTAAWAAWLVADPSSSAAGTDPSFAVPRGTAAAPGAGAQEPGIPPAIADPAAAVLAPSDPASPGGGDPAVSPARSSTTGVQPMSMDVTVAVVDGPPAVPPVGSGRAAAAPATAAAAPDTGTPTGSPAGLPAASTTTGTRAAATATGTYAAVAPATTTPAEVTSASVTPAPETTSDPEDTYQSRRHHDDGATETPAAPPDEDGGSATYCPATSTATSTPPISVVVEVPNLPTVSIPLP